MTHASFDTPFEIKFLAETGAFEGYASVFHVTDSVNDRVAPGAFRQSLARFHAEGRLPPLLWQHDTSEPIGTWREMYEDEHGLYVKGELFVTDIPLAREAMKLLKENVVTGLSIGYRAKSAHKDQKTGVRVLTEVDLHEVSLVTFPANEYARVSKIKRPFSAETPPSPREFESFLRASGLSRAQAKGILACGYKGLSQADDLEAAGLIVLVNDATRALKYSQNQPRVPAGNTDGGQWTDGDGSSGGQRINIADIILGHGRSLVTQKPRRVGTFAASNTIMSDASNFGGRVTNSGRFDIDIATDYLHSHLSQNRYGDGNCAANVSNAIRETGIKVAPPKPRKVGGKPWALDYGHSLRAAGFLAVARSELGGVYPPNKDYVPMGGDVVVIQSVPKHEAGHMAMYDGKDWVSDFIQENDIWSNLDYQRHKANYVIYRFQSVVD